MKNIYFFLIILFFSYSCSGIKDAGKVLRNEKVKTTDEFLVKKKDPLVLPPNFEEIPEPGSIIKKKEDEKEKIKKILKIPKSKNITNKSSSSVEDTILREIRK